MGCLFGFDLVTFLVTFGDMASSPSAAAAAASNPVREIHGVSVSFRKRKPGANYTMDFRVGGERFQETTGWPTMADAERAADKRVRELKERKQGLQAAGLAHQKAKGKYATVAEVVACLEDGAKVWDERTLQTYKSSLLRLARVVDAENPEGVGMERVLAESNLERFYAAGQGLAAVNWVDALPMNGGLNSTVRNVKALFRGRVLKIKFRDVKLPDLRVLEDMPAVRHTLDGFSPWPVEVYDAMHAASEVLKTEQPELWLVNAMLRRLGLRDEELLMARRDWIEVAGKQAWLKIQNRGAEFTVLKHGRFRKLELDEELQGLLLPREGFLVADGQSTAARFNLIYRTHNQWMRQFIPDRVKGNHELRMHAGSIVYTLHGLEAASHFLGHKSIVTTERYYASWLASAPKVDAALVAKARVVRVAA